MFYHADCLLISTSSLHFLMWASNRCVKDALGIQDARPDIAAGTGCVTILTKKEQTVVLVFGILIARVADAQNILGVRPW